MVTFDRIMETVERERVAVCVRNCLPASLLEAAAAAEKHPKLVVEFFNDEKNGICISIKPKEFKSSGAQAVRLAGHKSVVAFFRKKK